MQSKARAFRDASARKVYRVNKTTSMILEDSTLFDTDAGAPYLPDSDSQNQDPGQDYTEEPANDFGGHVRVEDKGRAVKRKGSRGVKGASGDLGKIQKIKKPMPSALYE